MSDLPVAPFEPPEDNLLVPIVEAVPLDPEIPGDPPIIDANAELVLPAETFAPWMRAIKGWLDRVGAVNGEDYRSSVSLNGQDAGKRLLWRVKWKALTPRGVLHLQAMAASLRALPREAKRLEGPKEV